jgi:hypothetical protein
VQAGESLVLCGDIVHLTNCALFVDDCGGRRRSFRVRPERKGYDTRILRFLPLCVVSILGLVSVNLNYCRHLYNAVLVAHQLLFITLLTIYHRLRVPAIDTFLVVRNMESELWYTCPQSKLPHSIPTNQHLAILSKLNALLNEHTNLLILQRAHPTTLERLMPIPLLLPPFADIFHWR